MTNNILAIKDCKFIIPSHFTMNMDDKGIKYISTRSRQVIDLKKGDIIGNEFNRTGWINRDKNKHIIGVSDKNQEIPKGCINTFRKVNKVIEVNYEKVRNEYVPTI